MAERFALLPALIGSTLWMGCGGVPGHHTPPDARPALAHARLVAPRPDSTLPALQTDLRRTTRSVVTLRRAAHETVGSARYLTARGVYRDGSSFVFTTQVDLSGRPLDHADVHRCEGGERGTVCRLHTPMGSDTTYHCAVIGTARANAWCSHTVSTARLALW